MRRIAVVAAVLALCASACSSASDSSTEDHVDGYRVVYRVVDAAPDAKSSMTETVEVRRPYDGRVETRIDGKITTGRITSREHFWQLGKGGELRFGVLRSPGGPARDASLEALRDAVDGGAALGGGTDTVLGRRCWWFAYRDPSPTALRPPTDESRVESCVDAAGIVLRDVWTLKGKPARILEAIEVRAAAPSKKRFMEGTDPASTKVTQPKGAELVETQTIVRDVLRGKISTPFSFKKPAGWTRDRVALVASTAGQGARPTQFLAQTFVTDDVAVVVETGSSPDLAPAWGTSEGRRIAIGVGEGRMVYGVDRVEIRVLSALGYARVIAPSEALARTFIERIGN